SLQSLQVVACMATRSGQVQHAAHRGVEARWAALKQLAEFGLAVMGPVNYRVPPVATWPPSTDEWHRAGLPRKRVGVSVLRAGAPGSSRDSAATGGVFWERNRCNRSCAWVTSRSGVAAEFPGSVHPGKIG